MDGQRTRAGYALLVPRPRLLHRLVGVHDELPVTTLPTPPAAPSDFVADRHSGKEIRLTWIDNATNEGGFVLQRATDIGGIPGDFATIATLGPDVTRYTDSAFRRGTWNYWYRIQAVNSGGASAWIVARTIH